MMTGAFLPGNSTVELRELAVPDPGYGKVQFDPSPDIIHDQKTVYGSWVTSTWLMEELVERLVAWNLHPASLVTHRFPLNCAGDAYSLMASGKCGKVAVCFDEELRA
jgi:threonine dehydrogenase-like Zn-dependent dehydrogenase